MINRVVWGTGIAVVLLALMLVESLPAAKTPLVRGGEASTFFVASAEAPLSVKARADYIADGTCDNEQVRAAIASLPLGYGGTVQLSSGPFYFCDTVDIVSIQLEKGWWPLLGKIMLRGEGRESTKVVPTASMPSLFKAVAPIGYTVRNVQIWDMQLQDETPYVTVALIDIRGKAGGFSGWNSINNVFLSLRAPATGDVSAVLLQAQMASSITNTMVALSGGAGGNVYGLRQYGGSFTTLNVDNLTIEGDSSGYTYGVQLAGWKHSLRHVVVEGHAVGIEFTSVNGGVSNSSDISGSYFEGNTIDIRLRGKQGGYQQIGTVIRDSYFGSSNIAIDLEYAQDTAILYNAFRGGYTTDIIREGIGTERVLRQGNNGPLTATW